MSSSSLSIGCFYAPWAFNDHRKAPPHRLFPVQPCSSLKHLHLFKIRIQGILSDRQALEHLSSSATISQQTLKEGQERPTVDDWPLKIVPERRGRPTNTEPMMHYADIPTTAPLTCELGSCIRGRGRRNLPPSLMIQEARIRTCTTPKLE